MKKEEPEISQEHFIGEHYFVYIVKGIMNLYDGVEHKALKSGEGCIARKNRLGRFNKLKEEGELEKIILALPEPFLRAFQEKYKKTSVSFSANDTFIPLKPNGLLSSFAQSLKPTYSHGTISEPFAELKLEELLLTLLLKQPELSGLFFDYGIPQKINLEEFMNRNYQFNVSIDRFAYLTGRSLSAFKRDFQATFHETPSHWLIKKRLQGGYFLIEKKKKKPSEIYLDLGFETLSHFSVAFKKQFGLTPTELGSKKRP